MDDENDNKTVTLTVKNVTPESRYMFNRICQSYGHDRGEYLSKMFEEETRRIFGDKSVERIKRSFLEDQEELRQRKLEKKGDSEPKEP